MGNDSNNAKNGNIKTATSIGSIKALIQKTSLIHLFYYKRKKIKSLVFEAKKPTSNSGLNVVLSMF